MLAEYDEHGAFLRSIGEGLFTHPHGLRIDDDDKLWTTDDGSHLVLKQSSAGRVLLVLGRKDVAAESDWLFNQPTDVAFWKNGEVYVADGYGNSRVVQFDREGKFLKAWGKYGTGPGEFNLPHTVAVDSQGKVYVGDRENKRVQIFDAEGNFLTEWTGIGYPYGLFIATDQHVWMIDGCYDRIIELDQSGKILGAVGEPGHAPGQLAWGHFMAVGKDGKIYVADVLKLALPGVCPYGVNRQDGEVRALEADVLGPPRELRLVHPNERAKKLGVLPRPVWPKHRERKNGDGGRTRCERESVVRRSAHGGLL